MLTSHEINYYFVIYNLNISNSCFTNVIIYVCLLIQFDGKVTKSF
jgi:hypothetical protein